MKKYIKYIMTLFMVIILLFTYVTPIGHAQADKEKITVTTTFLVDIVEQLAPETFEVVSIVPAGGDPHTYTATARNLKDITESDLVLFHGLHFEAQMAEVLDALPHTRSVTAEFNNDQLISISEDSQEVDPHYWFDIDLYKQSVLTTQQALVEIYPEYKELVNKNTERYIEELDALNQWIHEKVAELPVEQRILVTPHDAFAYFAQAYDFTVYAPQGISTESEVSNDAIIKTVKFIVDNDVPAIFLDTTSNPQAMEKLQEGVNQQDAEVVVVGGEGQELFSDSLAATGQSNDNYIEMYQHNVSLIVDHLIR